MSATSGRSGAIRPADRRSRVRYLPVMTGSAQSSPAPGVPEQGNRWHRPANGSLIAATGSAVMLVSLLLPWYAVRVQIIHYGDLSTSALLRLGDVRFLCDPACSESAGVGPLAAGVWDWRTLIAVGAAAMVLCVMVRAQNGSAPGRRDGQVLTALAVGTAGVTLAVVVSPVSVAGPAWLGITSAPSYGAAVGLGGAAAAVAGALLLWRGSARGASHQERLAPSSPRA